MVDSRVIMLESKRSHVCKAKWQAWETSKKIQKDVQKRGIAAKKLTGRGCTPLARRTLSRRKRRKRCTNHKKKKRTEKGLEKGGKKE